MDNWVTLYVSNNLLDLAGSIILDKKKVYLAPHGRRYIIRSTEYSDFHVKPSCSEGEDIKTNVSINKLIPKKDGLIRTENSITPSSKDRQAIITLKITLDIEWFLLDIT